MNLPTPLQQPTLTPKEVAEILGLGRDNTYRLIKSEKLASIRVGRKLLVPTAALWDFLLIKYEFETPKGNSSP